MIRTVVVTLAAIRATALVSPSAMPVRCRAVAPAINMRLGKFGGGNVGAGGVRRGRHFWSPKGPAGGDLGGNGGKGGGGGTRNAAEGDAEPEPEPEKVDESSKGLWAAYNNALEEKPLLMKGMTSFMGFLLGDIMAQTLIEKSGPYDPIRTARFASFGFLVHGTSSHWFYGNLDKLIPGTGAAAVASKVGIDQLIWNPIFGCMFFGYMGVLEGEGLGGAYKKIKRDLLTQVTGSWTVWPIAHAINFKFIPSSQRVLYINTIQIFYNCFLSILSSKKSDSATESA